MKRLCSKRNRCCLSCIECGDSYIQWRALNSKSIYLVTFKQCTNASKISVNIWPTRNVIAITVVREIPVVKRGKPFEDAGFWKVSLSAFQTGPIPAPLVPITEPFSAYETWGAALVPPRNAIRPLSPEPGSFIIDSLYSKSTDWLQ